MEGVKDLLTELLPQIIEQNKPLGGKLLKLKQEGDKLVILFSYELEDPDESDLVGFEGETLEFIKQNRDQLEDVDLEFLSAPKRSINEIEDYTLVSKTTIRKRIANGIYKRARGRVAMATSLSVVKFAVEGDDADGKEE